MHRIHLTIIALLALALPAGAQECVPTNAGYAAQTPATGVDLYGTFTGGSGGDEGVYYAVVDSCQLCTYGFLLWIYEEANGIPELQRGDEVIDNTCGGKIRSDAIIF